jgi:hypothetical protein
MGSIREKNRGKKSRATVPLKGVEVRFHDFYNHPCPPTWLSQLWTWKAQIRVPAAIRI